MSESDTLALQCVGRILKPARLMAGKGMRQFAQEIGLLPSRISEIETGSPPTAAELKLMADALEAARREGIDWRESTVATLAARESELAEAKRFKAYTHARMDQLGAPHEVPDSEHTQAGCRIGGRFDWVERQLAELKQRVAELEGAILSLKNADHYDHWCVRLSDSEFAALQKCFTLLPPDRITPTEPKK